VLPDDLYIVPGQWPRHGRPIKHDVESCTVTDDWPDRPDAEYQSKESAKQVLRALKENARQGFWNGSLPPIGYRVVAAEQCGARVKKKLEADSLHAETVPLTYRLALEGEGTSGPMGVNNIAAYLNQAQGNRASSSHPDPQVLSASTSSTNAPRTRH
jgi:hypothetical protein